MKNKKGSVVVIAIIMVIVAITTSIIIWIAATKMRAPVQQVAVTQSTTQSRAVSSSDSSANPANCKKPLATDKESVIYTIDISGGIICSSDKNMWLKIPEGSLDSAKEIKIKIINDDNAGIIYDISPVQQNNIVFLKPAIEYINTNVISEDGGVLVSDPRLYKLDKQLRILREDDSAIFDKKTNILSTIITEIEK